MEADGEREKTLAGDRPARRIKASAYPGYWESRAVVDKRLSAGALDEKY